jgi:MtaA/CmuA family methyltransferase
MAICYDIRFPELFRKQAMAGAEAVIVPAAWYKGEMKEEQWQTLLMARAHEDTCYVVGVGNANEAFIGRSMVASPSGIKALDLYRERVGKDKIIEGWIEGPIAEAADLRGINTLMLDFFDDPVFVRDLFAFVIEMELRFAREQLKVGADVIGVGDAAASLVGPDIYDEFVWPYEKKLVDGIHALGGKVRLHICGNTRRILEGMGKLGCEIVDLDSMAPISEARQQMGPKTILLGNLNPVAVLRNGDAAGVTAAIAECHRQAGAPFIVGAGCEVPRDTPAENLRALCAYAHSHQP